MRAYTILLENSVQFLWHDSDFVDMLTTLSHDSHPHGTEHPTDSPEDNSHYVEQLLSPLIVSSQILQDAFLDPISVITCNRVGCNIVFQYYDDCYYVGFCGNEQFSVYNMQKQLHVLREIIAFYVGPCKKSINPRNGIDRSRTWNKITKAVESFIELHEAEQSFLVGGIEKLHFNNDVQQNCLKIIEKVMDNNIKNLQRGKYFRMLLVKNKIAVYEAGPKVNYVLSTGDILRIITVCNSKFKQVDDIDLVEASSAADALEFSMSDDSDATSSNSTSFSPIRLKKSATIPKRKASMNPKLKVHFHDTWKSSSLPRSDFFAEENLKFSSVAENCEELSVSEEAIGSVESRVDSIDDPTQVTHQSLRIRRKTMSDIRISEEIGEFSLSHEDIHTMPVFLNTVECEFTPFLMHTMKISDDVNFVLLTEMKHVDIASIICKFISLLKKIDFKADTSRDATKGSLILTVKGGIRTYEKMGDLCKDLKSKLRHVRNDRQVRRIVATWEKTISPHLRDFLSQKKIRYVDKLERNTNELSSMLQTLFQQIFLLKPRSKSNLKGKLVNFTLELKKSLADHLDFFRAKAMRNLSISLSYENYPGLLHFMLIQRWKRITGIMPAIGQILLDEVHTSGLYIPEESEISDDRVLQVRRRLKNRVSRGVLSAYANVIGQEGVSHYSIIEGDFKTTSFYWTRTSETVTLRSLANTSLNSWHGSATLSGFDSPFSGIKCSDKVEAKFLFLEMHLVHFATVPDDTVTRHANIVLDNFSHNKYDV